MEPLVTTQWCCDLRPVTELIPVPGAYSWRTREPYACTRLGPFADQLLNTLYRYLSPVTLDCATFI
jgi:hypothetical protein